MGTALQQPVYSTDQNTRLRERPVRPAPSEQDGPIVESIQDARTQLLELLEDLYGHRGDWEPLKRRAELAFAELASQPSPPARYQIYRVRDRVLDRLNMMPTPWPDVTDKEREKLWKAVTIKVRDFFGERKGLVRLVYGPPPRSE